MPNPIIKVDNVKKHFKEVKAVDGISLEVNQGEFLALLGPNGAGKTTLVEMIEGIQKPDSGTILINGKKWRGNADELHGMLGISLQETKFIEKLRVNETLKLFASFYRLESSRVNEVLEMIGLTEKYRSFTKNLSGGQRQKLALGIALLNHPKILLLDEPTTGLDPTARREMWNILLAFKEKGDTSLILTTHYMEEAEILCDNIVIIDTGTILSQGTLDELLSRNKTSQIIEFTLEEELKELDLSSIEGSRPVKWNARKKKGRLLVNDIAHDLPAFLSAMKEKELVLKSLECRKMTLDDLFISLTGRHLDN